MSDLGNIVPIGYVEASFAGHNEKGILVDIDRNSCDIEEYFLALYDGKGSWTYDSQDRSLISYNSLNKAVKGEGQFFVCMVSTENNQISATYLRKTDLKVPKQCNQEMYDKRALYGTPIQGRTDKVVLPCYQEDKLLAVEFCEENVYTYYSQMKNEILYVYPMMSEEDEAEVLGYTMYTKCKRTDGNYMGIISRDLCKTENIAEHVIEYTKYTEDKEYSYMSFKLTKEQYAEKHKYAVAWSSKGQLYFAPLCEKKEKDIATISEFNSSQAEGISLKVVYDEERYGKYQNTKLIGDVKLWEVCEDIDVKEVSCTYENGQCILSYKINTLETLKTFGNWFIQVQTCKEEIDYHLEVVVQEELEQKELYDGTDTKRKVNFKTKDNVLLLNRVFGHNAMFKKNMQEAEEGVETLDEFLSCIGVEPQGDMHAEYIEGNGSLRIKLYQNMKNVVEARLVMYHSQGMGVLATQEIPVIDGVVDEFEVKTPDIDADGKFLKPITSVWFRVAIALRNDEGIYFARLMNYDIDTQIEQKGQIYDSRKLYLKPIGDSTICEINMTALPYYAGNKTLSMKYVRPEQLYRSQFTNELLDVKIKKDIMTVKMRCRDCGINYKGVLMEYRKVKEDDAETYLIPYESLKEENGSFIMTTKIDMKKYYMRMLYWDIRCAFEEDGQIYTVSCHSNNRKFLRKYKNVFVDRTYPNDNSILFPYATGNDSVALMHRESCPQDHWNFRLKEKIAQTIYNMFKKHWDSKNIYLIFEKYCTMAQDNGFFFFKYCMEANVEAEFDGEIYYVIDPKQADWEKVVPYKKHVLKYLSLKHMIYLQACKLMISTDTKGHAYVWRSMGSDIKALTYQKKLVFLQHGVTAFKRGHFERGTNVGCESFITTSQFEHDIIHNYLGYPEDEVPITGFARWDVLHDKSEGHREILMMPTWRTWLDDAENEVFAESDYCKNYMALLNNPKLDEILKSHDVTLNFYLHPKFRKFITEFSVVSDNIRLIPFGEAPLNELMMECNLLITDFSSVAWDVYYMNKPVLFYHFDLEDANKTLGFYMDMKNDIFGDRAETPDELMALITEYIESGFQMKAKYSKDREKYFAYVDDNNSERIWKAIQERRW